MPASVTFDQQDDKPDAREHQVPVFGGEPQGQRKRVVVVGEKELFGREAFLRVVEVNRIGEVEGDDQHRIDRRVVPEKQCAVPPTLAQRGGQQRKQDERGIGIEHRGGVEQQSAPQQRPELRARNRADQRAVIEVENRAAERQHDVEQCQPPDEQRGVASEPAFHLTGFQ